MRVFRAESAKFDLDGITEYYGNLNPDATQAMLERVVQVEAVVAEHPHIGRPGRVEGTREAVVAGTPFVLIYTVDEDRIRVLRVLHERRDWPGSS